MKKTIILGAEFISPDYETLGFIEFPKNSDKDNIYEIDLKEKDLPENFDLEKYLIFYDPDFNNLRLQWGLWILSEEGKEYISKSELNKVSGVWVVGFREIKEA